MGALRVGGATYATGHPIGNNQAVFLVIKRAPPAAGAVAAAGPSLTEADVAALKAELAEAKQEIAGLKAQLGIG
jgi:hypothetical protein